MKYDPVSGNYQYGDQDGRNNALLAFSVAGFVQAWRKTFPMPTPQHNRGLLLVSVTMIGIGIAQLMPGLPFFEPRKPYRP